MRHIFISFVTAVLLAVLPLHTVWAQDNLPREKHISLQQLESQGYRVEFLGNAYGVDGWMIRDDEDRVQYAYTTPQGGLITGLLFEPDGTVHTAKQLERFADITLEGSQEARRFDDPVMASNAPRSERIYARVQDSKYFTVGSQEAPYIYTFINPTCIHCVEFWTNHMQSVVDSGDIQIRFIPFGREDVNRDAAALLLSAADAENIWRQYAAGNQDVFAVGANGNIPSGIYDAVDLNSALFADLRLQHVPFSIYRARSDGQIKVVAGQPENVMMLLADFIR